MTWELNTGNTWNAPNYIIRFGSLPSKQYSVQPVKSPSRTTIVCIDALSGVAQQLEKLLSRLTVGEVVFDMLNVDDELAGILGTDASSPVIDTLINEKIQVLGGYREDPESEYRDMTGGEIRAFRTVDDLIARFTVHSMAGRFNLNLFPGLDQINIFQGVKVFTIRPVQQAGQTTMAVDGISGASMIGIRWLLFEKGGFQAEIVTVTDVNGDIVTLSRPLTFTWSDPLSGAGNEPDVMTTAIRLRGHVVDVFHALLTGEYSTFESVTDFPLEAVFVPDGYTAPGLGFVDADLDLDLFRLCRENMPEVNVDFLFQQSTRARSFFEQHLFPLGFFPFITAEGKLGVRSYLPPGPFDDLETITPDHWIDRPEWERILEEHVNRVVVLGDHDIAGQGFERPNSNAITEDTADQTLTNEIAEHEIASHGVRSALDYFKLGRRIGKRVLRRFLKTPEEIGGDLIFTKRAMQIGDICSITDPTMPDPRTGAFGLTDAIFEAIRVDPDWASGRIRVVLQRTAAGLWAWLGPGGQPAWDSATAAQKRWAYWSDTADTLGAGADPGFKTF